MSTAMSGIETDHEDLAAEHDFDYEDLAVEHDFDSYSDHDHEDLANIPLVQHPSVQITRRYFGTDPPWYRAPQVMSGTAIHPPWSWPSEAQRQATGLRLYHRGDCVIGRDDHVLYDSDVVFVVDHTAYKLPTPIQKVNYFHSEMDGYVIAQMYYDEIDVRAYDMLHTNGCFAKAMRSIQRLFRARQRLFRARQIFTTLQARRLLPMHINTPEITYAIATNLPR
jgi:hypothetical protein